MEKPRCSCCDAADEASSGCAECSNLKAGNGNPKADEGKLKVDADIPALICPNCSNICSSPKAKFCEECGTKIQVEKPEAELQGTFFHES